MKLLLATRSAHKVTEIRHIFRRLPGCRDVELLDLDAAGVTPSADEEELEPYETFRENAASKARYFRAMTGLPTVADDSGLEVDALGRRPGVRSKRFSPEAGRLTGEELDRANNRHLLELLGDLPLPERTARYVCVAVLDAGEGEESRAFRGEAPGLILGRPRGRGGFGYDPLFYDPALGRTFAEIDREEKNERSHRGEAFRKVAGHLGTKAG